MASNTLRLMTFRSLTLALGVALFTQGLSIAQAQPRDYRPQRDQGYGGGEYGRPGPQVRPGGVHNPGRGEMPPGLQRVRNGRMDQGRGRGAGPDHNYYRGSRLPRQWRSNEYVVDNWRAHRLSPPPRGFHWVQTGGDYVLVAIGSGIILQFILGQ